jgi:DNA helicase HerA-like ATPase
MLRRIFERHPNAHILLLDPHNEYATAFSDCAEVLDPQSLQLPYWLFNFDEFCEVVLGPTGQARNAETAILSECIPAAKRAFLGKGEDGKHVTIDTPVPYRMAELIQLIDETMGKLDHPEELGPYLRLKTRLNNLRTDSRFAFMFSGISVRDNMADILSKIFRIPVDGKPITIVDLSGIPSEILNVVVSVLCRMTFDLALYADRAMPMMLVCEEAHRYVPQNPDLGFEPTKRALARIAKEGRKYGVSLCVVSQRPSELAAEILSQCNTTFALRLTNQKDQDYVRSIMSESALGLLDFLPSLRNAEAIAVGEGVSVPVRIRFDDLPEEHRPRSGTVSHSTAWGGAEAAGGNLPNLALVIERWRHQTR